MSWNKSRRRGKLSFIHANGLRGEVRREFPKAAPSKVLSNFTDGNEGDNPLLTQVIYRPTVNANGQSAAHIIGLVGLAGAALIWHGDYGALTTPVTQPTPVPESISHLDRATDQPQPVFSRFPHPEIVVQQQILRPTVSVRDQDSVEIQQPVIVKQFFDNTLPKSVFTVPQTELTQLAPVIQRFFHPEVPAAPLIPIKQWSVKEQEYSQGQPRINRYFHPEVVVGEQPTPVIGSISYIDRLLDQPAPVIYKYFHAPVVVADTVPYHFVNAREQEYRQVQQSKILGQSDGARLPYREFTAIPHQVIEPTQPRVNKYFFTPAVVENPVNRPIGVTRQDSTEQIQPRIDRYFFAPAVLETPRIRSFFASQQASTEVIQPRITKKFFAPAANIYTITPSGAVAFSGAPSFDQTNVIPVSGSVTFSGAATYIRINTIVASGGVEFTQTVTQNHTNVIQTSGSVVFSGGAGIVFIPAGGTLNRIVSRLNMKISKAMGL